MAVSRAYFLAGLHGHQDVPPFVVAGRGVFLDIGCFQGFNSEERHAEGDGVTAMANPEATMLMLAFGPTRMHSFLGGASQEDVEIAFPDWERLAIEPAATEGLGWPMNRTAPQWYRLRRVPAERVGHIQ